MDLSSIAKQLVMSPKGILAADESFPTIEKRFKTIGIESTPENRRAYRELLFTTPEIEKYISGIIQFEETLKDKILTNTNIISGIKVDQGTEDFGTNPGDKVTKGIETLDARLKEHSQLGAKFTKWRAVFVIAPEAPSIQCVNENARLLAEFAKISQQNGMVPIVEPEILMDGVHDIEKCYERTRSILKVVFMKLKDASIDLTGMLLKTNMILPGNESGQKVESADIAQKTLEVLKDVVPAEVPGIVFLSGGQTPDEATQNLNEINKLKGDAPWQLSFSYGRALQDEALKAWGGNPQNIKLAQDKFRQRLNLVSLAREGKLA